MSEEKKQEEKQEEVSPAEAKARGNGWAPAEEWKGPEADWVDFKDFNLRGEFMGRIHEQSGIIKHLTNKVDDRDKALKDMSDLQGKISEREYNKALKDLQAQKKEAYEESNFDTLVDIDEEISELKAHKPSKEVIEETQQQQGGDVPQEIVEWLSKPEQSWYHTDFTMQSIAEGIGSGILQKNPNVTPTELIKQVDAAMRKELPHKFKSAGVDEGGEYNKGGGGGGGKPKLPSFSSLTEEQQAVCKRFERLETMTRKEYIESLVEIGEL